MKLKLPATNLSYVILNVKYTLDGKECECNMHMLNDNKMDEVKVDTPSESIITTVTMNEVTNAKVIVSSQVLYEIPEPDTSHTIHAEPGEVVAELETTTGPTGLRMETKVEAKVERKTESKKEKHAPTHSERETKGQSTGRTKEESKGKEREEK